ncbi:hypothetical protein B296_00042594 [Ensete ventricosum]|uniref:Uncharacterized protein n=1 Tax=Ensete ventricosum TaxID=4639 RepID=A0A426XTK5_ENSVE|nr:hypothetical protein B296_00042594 [Ensete ventricosum]
MRPRNSPRDSVRRMVHTSYESPRFIGPHVQGTYGTSLPRARRSSRGSRMPLPYSRSIWRQQRRSL